MKTGELELVPRPGGSTRAWRTTRAAIWAWDRGICQACRTHTHLDRCSVRGCGRCYQAGHMIPIARGGTDDMHNLVTLCATCNLEQGDTPMGGDLYPLQHQRT